MLMYLSLTKQEFQPKSRVGWDGFKRRLFKEISKLLVKEKKKAKNENPHLIFGNTNVPHS
jgi:hypothetical protein